MVNLLSVLQPTPPEIWKQISKESVIVEKLSRKRPANVHTYVKGPYTKIDDLILKMEVGKVYTSNELCEIWGQSRARLPQSATRRRRWLLTMYDDRTNLGQQVGGNIREYFGDKVFSTVIPRHVRLGEAPSHGIPVILYDARSRGAEAYVALAREFLSRRASLTKA